MIDPSAFIDVPEPKWIKVDNDIIANGNGEFTKGESCSILPGGRMHIVDETPTYYVVEYVIDEVQYGAPCPSLTRFRWPKHE